MRRQIQNLGLVRINRQKKSKKNPDLFLCVIDESLGGRYFDRSRESHTGERFPFHSVVLFLFSLSDSGFSVFDSFKFLLDFEFNVHFRFFVGFDFDFFRLRLFALVKFLCVCLADGSENGDWSDFLSLPLI